MNTGLQVNDQDVVTIQISRQAAEYFRTFLWIEYHSLDDSEDNQHDNEMLNELWSAIVSEIGNTQE